MGDKQRPVDIAKAAIEHAQHNQQNVVLIDTAGRLHVDEDMMQELADIKANISVDATILVVDAMTGQDAVNVAKTFTDKVGIDGVILTKLAPRRIQASVWILIFDNSITIIYRRKNFKEVKFNMAVKIRLRRMGYKKHPFYRVVVADSRSPRDGRFIDEIGTYDPNQEPASVKIDSDAAKKWLADGAQPTDTVAKLLKQAGIEK